jgi:hypothetical protein
MGFNDVTNQAAVTGAKAYRDSLGLPSYESIFSKAGGGAKTGPPQSVKERTATTVARPTGPQLLETGGRYKDKVFGNAGEAKAAAAAAKGELGQWKAELAKGKAELAKLRGFIQDPTSSQGFKTVMAMAGERLGHATEAERQQQAEAQSRRGFVGGYNPESTERARLESIAMAGGQAVLDERAAQQQQFAMEGDVYGTDVGAYGTALDAATQAAMAAASIPTESWASDRQTTVNPEWGAYNAALDRADERTRAEYARETANADRAQKAEQANADRLYQLYGQFMGGGGFGDIFGTASKNAMFDTTNMRTDRDRATAIRKAQGGAGTSQSKLR